MCQRIRFALLAIVLVGLMGCATSQDSDAGNPNKSARESIDAIEMFMLPTVINWDNIPGPDGVQVRIILFSAAQPEPVKLTQGKIEFVLYEGKYSAEEIANSDDKKLKPFFMWTYTPAQLSTALEKSVIGFGYSMQLGWGKSVPKSGLITVVTRYRQPSGNMVYSAPVILPMPGQ